MSTDVTPVAAPWQTLDMFAEAMGRLAAQGDENVHPLLVSGLEECGFGAAFKGAKARALQEIADREAGDPFRRIGLAIRAKFVLADLKFREIADLAGITLADLHDYLAGRNRNLQGQIAIFSAYSVLSGKYGLRLNKFWGELLGAPKGDDKERISA